MKLQIHTLFRPSQVNGRAATTTYREWAPSPKLAPFVSCYWFSEPIPLNQEKASSEAFNALVLENVGRVLPDGCSDIIFEHDLNGNACRAFVTGIFDEPFTIAYNQHRPMRNFGIRFFPGGIYTLLGIPQHEMAYSRFDIDLVWAVVDHEIQERVFAEPLFQEKVKIVEDALITFLSSRTLMNNSVINNLLYHVFESKGKMGIQHLANTEVISTRQMNRIFYQWIGLSPKRFSEVVRFQAVINHIKRPSNTDSGLAYDYGYYDQAHMLREFKRFYGESLSVAIKEFGHMSDFYNHDVEQT